jgi:hypothetical protein
MNGVALLDAAGVAQVLAKCSPRTIAAMLQIAQWPWADEACASLPAQLRLSARGRSQQVAKPAPEFADALCLALLDAVQARRGTELPNTTDRRGWLERMMRWKP